MTCQSSGLNLTVFITLKCDLDVTGVHIRRLFVGRKRCTFIKGAS